MFERLRPGLKRENARGVPLPVVVRVDTRVNASDKGNYVLYSELLFCQPCWAFACACVPPISLDPRAHMYVRVTSYRVHLP